MNWAREDTLRRLGLSGGSRKGNAPVLLTGAATDPKTGLIAALSSETTFDKNKNPSVVSIDYWRHLPYGESLKQDLIRIAFKPVTGKTDEVALDKMWVQSRLVFDSEKGDSLDNTADQKNVNRVLGAVSRLNGLLRDQGPIEDTAKILVSESHLDQVIGEHLTIRGLDPNGGFAPMLLTGTFYRAANHGYDNGGAPPLELSHLDANMLKTVLGFRVNTLEPDKNHIGSRQTSAADSESGVGYRSGVTLREDGDTIEVTFNTEPEAVPSGLAPKAIPTFLKFSFKKTGDDTWQLQESVFDDQKEDSSDISTVAKMIGMAQAANRDLASWKYPALMDHIAKYDMLDRISQLPAPPPLEKGGEMLYVSLHGSGHEKRIENFGDQIGIAALFLQRGTDKDGYVDSVGMAVDFPFATGGPTSGYDGAVPDYLPFWNDIKAFAITHDHFDHAGGFAYYARMKLLKDKTVYATDRVKRSLEESMNNMNVPREYRPKIIPLKQEGATPIKDDNGNVRFWLQYSPNATKHSALTTPYIVTGCYNDEHYNASAVVYGDSRGIKAKNVPFFQTGTRALPELAKEHGLTVTPAKVDRDITLALHDVTAVRYEGSSPDPEEVEENLGKVVDLFKGKGVLMDPISTNHAEYVADLNIAHKTGRNVTAVGANAERRLSSLNLFGVDPDINLRDIKIDPKEERTKAEADRLIPSDILEDYFAMVDQIGDVKKSIKLEEYDVEKWSETEKVAWDNKLAQLRKDMFGDKAEDQLSGREKGKFERAKEQMWEDFSLEDIPQEGWTREQRSFYNSEIERVHDEIATKVMEKLPPERRGHENNTREYIWDSLVKYGTVQFENDINGYFMWKAITEKQDTASLRATRGTKMAQGWRTGDPGSLMIFVTGTQGTTEEKFSTLRKFQDAFSLLDADPAVRNTGYKIKAEDYVVIMSQPAIPGNDASQAQMIRDLVRSRDVTVVNAFMNGFIVYNPKDKKDELVRNFRQMGWNPELDLDGNIHIHSHPIHVHGHGFKKDLLQVAQSVHAEVNTAHHIPDRDSYSLFRDLMKKNNMTYSDQEPDDFKVFRVDANQEEMQDKLEHVTNINPSYILVRMVRKYGQFFGGALEWARTTMLRREGYNRSDGLHANSASDGTYTKSTARAAWEAISNPDKRDDSLEAMRRNRKLGPSPVDRQPDVAPRSRPMLGSDNALPEGPGGPS